MRELEKARLKVLAMFENNRSWVEWIHEGTLPARTQTAKTLNALVGIMSKHCPNCLNLNGCWFLKSNMPESPLHPNCHCTAESIPAPIAGVTAIAECDIGKFTNYVFNSNKKNGKYALFEAWGYDIIDSEWLQLEFIMQAQEKYASGNYILGKLDIFGQRLNIEITLPRYEGKTSVTFISGWMVYPSGIIKLATPYGGTI